MTETPDNQTNAMRSIIDQKMIDRRDEAERVVDFIRSAKSNVVVLFGSHGAGKSTLVQEHVISMLRRQDSGAQIAYASCDPDIPSRVPWKESSIDIWEFLNQDSILFLDHFDRTATVSRGHGRDAFDRLLENADSDQIRGKIVLILDEKQFSSLFYSSELLPQLLNNVYEIGGIGFDNGFRKMADSTEVAIECDASTLEALAKDAQQLLPPGSVNPSIELVKAVYLQFQFLTDGPSPRRISIENYDQFGGLGEILWGRFENLLKDSETDEHREFAQEFLEELATDKSGASIRSVAARCEIDEDVGEEIIAWLQSQGLLELSAAGNLKIVPSELVVLLRERASRKIAKLSLVLGLVSDAFESWRQLGKILSEEEFKQVSRFRHQLRLSESQCQFMLDCAIQLESRSGKKIRYWLSRIRSRDVKIEILLGRLFQSAGEIRQRAATALAAFDDEEVRHGLLTAALQDSDLAVRRSAVSSLAKLTHEHLWDIIVDEVKEPNSVLRLPAVEALRMFQSKQAVEILAAIIEDPKEELAARVSAIGTLQDIGSKASLDALIRIALRDEDEEDRDAAAQALAGVQSEDLTQYVLDGLRTARANVVMQVKPRKHFLAMTGNFVLAAIAILVSFPVAGLLLFILRRYVLGIGVTAIQWFAVWMMDTSPGASLEIWDWLIVLAFLAGYLIPTGILFRAERYSEPAHSFHHMLNTCLFLANSLFTFSWLHGLGQILAGRYRSGLKLFGLYLLGILIVLLAFDFQRRYSLAWIFYIYMIPGVFAIVISYLRDLWLTFRDHVRFGDMIVLKDRRDHVYLELAQNGFVVNCLNTLATGPVKSDARWAKKFLRKYGHRINPGKLVALMMQAHPEPASWVTKKLVDSKVPATVEQLKNLWPQASTRMKGAIATVLCRQPTDQSLDAMTRIDQNHVLSKMHRLKLRLARWEHVYRVLPKALVFAVIAVLPLLYLYVDEHLDGWYHPESILINIVKRPGDVDVRAGVIGILADEYPSNSFETLESTFRAYAIEAALRNSAGKGLGRIANNPSAEHAKTAEQAWDVLAYTAKAEYSNTDVRLAAFLGLRNAESRPDDWAELGNDNVIHERLAAVLKSRSYDIEFRETAIILLARLGTETAKTHLEDFVESNERFREVTKGVVGPGENPGQRNRERRQLNERAKLALNRFQGSVIQDAQHAYNIMDYKRTIEKIEPLLGSTNSSNRGSILFLLGRASLAQSKLDASQGHELRARGTKYLEEYLSEFDAQEASEKAIAQELFDAYIFEAGYLMNEAKTFDAQTALLNSRKATALAGKYSLDAERKSTANVWSGYLLYTIGQEEDALKALTDAVDDNPYDYLAYYWVGWYYYQTADFENARDWSRKAIDRAKDYDTSYDSYALILYSSALSGDLESGAEQLKDLAQEYPDSVLPGYFLSILYHEYLSAQDSQSGGSGYYEQAYQELESLKNDNQLWMELPDWLKIGILANFVEVSFVTKRYEGAIAAAEQFLTGALAPDESTQLAMTFIMYASALIDNKQSAPALLEQLITMFEQLPNNFVSSWQFDGTMRFIRHAQIDEGEALIALADSISGKPSETFQAAIADVQRFISPTQTAVTP